MSKNAFQGREREFEFAAGEADMAEEDDPRIDSIRDAPRGGDFRFHVKIFFRQRCPDDAIGYDDAEIILVLMEDPTRKTLEQVREISMR